MSLGDFQYDPKLEQDFGRRETRKLAIMENGAKYTGEWLVGTQIREGRGTQVWPDGSIYEGYWKNNQTQGLGRLIHADGDVYEGEWRQDKAHGHGTYLHLDGAKYEGEW